jgi:hypothetical protein
MHDKLHQFTRNDVWTLVPRPAKHNIIGTKWIFKNKTYELGTVVRNKARLVADVNPVKNNETQQRKGTQDRSMDRFEWKTSTVVYDKQEPRYKEDATNGGGNSV